MCCSLGWGQFGKIFFQLLWCKASGVEVVVMITSLSKSWNTDLRTLYAYLQGKLDQFLAWHYHRLFFSPEAFYLSQLFFFVMGWVSKATVAEAYCHVNHHAEQLVLQVQGAVHTDCLWDSCWLLYGLPSGCFMEAWTVPSASVFFSKLCHKIPQTSLLIMYKNFTRTSHPGKWGSLKNLRLMVLRRMILLMFPRMVFRRMVLVVFLLWMSLMPHHHLHHHHHHHHRLQSPCILRIMQLWCLQSPWTLRIMHLWCLQSPWTLRIMQLCHQSPCILLHKMQSCHWDKIFFIVLKDCPSLQAFVSLLLHQTRLELMTDAGIAVNVQKMILNLKPLHQHFMMILWLYLIFF